MSKRLTPTSSSPSKVVNLKDYRRLRSTGHRPDLALWLLRTGKPPAAAAAIPYGILELDGDGAIKYHNYSEGDSAVGRNLFNDFPIFKSLKARFECVRDEKDEREEDSEFEIPGASGYLVKILNSVTVIINRGERW